MLTVGLFVLRAIQAEVAKLETVKTPLRPLRPDIGRILSVNENMAG
jgi:hypothetical protein